MNLDCNSRSTIMESHRGCICPGRRHGWHAMIRLELLAVPPSRLGDDRVEALGAGWEASWLSGLNRSKSVQVPRSLRFSAHPTVARDRGNRFSSL